MVMAELLVLYALGVAHGAFAGYREAAGRNLLVDKRRYYAAAVFRGVVAGNVAAVPILATLLWLNATDDDPARLADDLAAAGQSALAVYLAYTAAIGATFVLHAVPSLELRALTTIALFGPLTLALPFVILAGAAAALHTRPTFAVGALFAVSIAAVSLVEPALSWLGFSRRAARAAHGAEVVPERPVE